MGLSSLIKVAQGKNAANVSFEDAFLKGYEAAVVKYEEEHKQPIPADYFRPSSMYGCERMLYFMRTGEEQDKEEHDINLMEICHSGTDRHLRIQHLVESMEGVKTLDLEEMVKEAQAKGVNTDFVGWNEDHTEAILERVKCTVKNGECVCVWNYTFYSPDNALISGIKAILAEEYSRELSKKINNSYKRRIEAAKNGEKISIVNNSRSLGYDKVNGELVINEKEAEVVRMIFNMYASGEGLRAISNTLYDMGYRNRSGNEIDPTTISRMLSSEKYKGVYVINQRHYDFDTKKTVLNPKSEWVHIPGAVPAIVEPELWDRVQEIKGSKVQSIKNEKRGRNCGKSIFSGKIYCAKCGAKYWRSLENGYVKFKCSSYSKYGKIPGKGCDNKSFSENTLYSILQSLSEQIVEVNTAEVRKSLLNWLESLRERLRASQGDDTIKEEIRKQTARKEKLTDAYMDGIISKEDYSKRYKELEKTLEDLKDKLLTLEVNEDLQSIEEVIQNIDKEMEEYLQTQSFNESRVEFLNQHLTKVTVNKDSFLLEFDLIGGAILTGKDFYLFVDNPRRHCKSSKGSSGCIGSVVYDCYLRE